MNHHYDAIWLNACLVTCEQGYGLINPGAIAVKDGKIAWIGSMAEFPTHATAIDIYDAEGRVITPGLIDCHTHLVFAGHRAHEFEQRLQGIRYEEIARQGGGIQSTVSATRAASEDSLLQQSLKRAKTMQQNGTTLIEIKSGYGLDWPTEVKMLRVAKRLEEILPLSVVRTFLGAHTIPQEYINHPDAYVNLLCDEMIPQIASWQLAEAVDVFCEKIAFNIQQTERIFQTAEQYHLAVKCHAEQLSHLGAAKLAAQYQALSVDHLEYLTPADINVLAKTKTVAVLLPGALYFLREKKYPPLEELRAARIPIALASDCNPGTSPVLSLLLIMNMACTLLRMTPEEALSGVTKHAAQALRRGDTHGTLRVNKIADLAIWDAAHPVELVYYLGSQPLYQLIKKGKII